MKLDVVEKKENPFLKRTDLILTVDHKGQATPKTEDIEKSIAEEFKTVPEKVEVVYILSEKGLAKSRVKAKVWKEKTVEKKKKTTPKKEAPDESKVEEKKQETKPEEKVKKEETKPKEEPKKEQSKPEKKEVEKK
jgi:ribosomal protein S24E